ncbi:MAG TPA: DNA translocase FtsK 4TM domain-containing protein [Candidatus Alectryocaccobium stercorigallinarum]|nr:DNA translocase FtsK 4TM domain-containing protein [Candidatus Alectryocaccobium stercorigallinarum]
MAGKKDQQKNSSPVELDIAVLIVLGISVLLFISTIGLCGIIGQGISFLLFGLVGTPAYAFPFVLFFITIFIIYNKERASFKRKLVGISGLYVLACAFFQLVMIGYDPSYFVFQCFIDSAHDHLGGGLIGGIITQLLGTLIGIVGAYIVLIIGIIIFAIILTQRPLVSALRNNTKKAYTHAMETRAIRMEEKKSRPPKKKSGFGIGSFKFGADEGDEDEDDLDEFGLDEEPEKPARSRKASSAGKDDIFDKYISGKSKASSEAENVSYADDTDDFSDFEDMEDDFDDDGFDELEEPDDIGDVPKTAAGSKKKGSGSFVIGKAAESVVNKSKSTAAAYKLPPLNLLKKGGVTSTKELTAQVKETAKKLQQTLHSFGVEAKVINASCGPTVTRYELQPEQGVKVSKIVGLTDDIKLNLAASDIRIEAPIPGKAAIGIEVPNKTNNAVLLRELLDTDEFKQSKSKLSFAVGKDLAGKPVISDIAKMPHLLIAGATGSGKSVCINTLIMSILYKAAPDEVKFIMIDPKVVELSVYNGIPHLLSPVVTDPKKAAGALAWAVTEMTRRYNLFAEFGVRDLKGYNLKADSLAHFANEEEEAPEILPQIVIVVDELADLMMVAPGEVEDSICRLAQLARAAGLHLIIATQRPSVNVITGLIKANMPSRIALSVTSGIDSRVILDMNGAEKLLGKGDMLFYPSGYAKPARVQGGFVSDDEIQKVVDFISKTGAGYDTSVQEAIDSSAPVQSAAVSQDDRDVYFADAGKFIIEKDKASIGMLQRVFKIGFNRAARIMDQLCEAGVVGEEEGTKPRKILMTSEQFENYLEENG